MRKNDMIMKQKRKKYDCPYVRTIQTIHSELLAKSTSSEILTVGKSRIFIDEEEDSIIVNNDSIWLDDEE